MTSCVAPTISARRAAAFDCGRDVAGSNTGFACSIRHIHKLLAIRADYRAVTALISILVSLRNPLHVIWLIVAVVIDTVHREIVSITVRKRPVAKCSKRQMPFLTNLDAARAIVLKRLTIWIATPIKHSLPDMPKATLATSMSYAKAFVGIYSIATARLCIFAFQRMAGYCDFVSTSTLALPKRFSTNAANAFDGRQSTKCLAGDIFEGGQGGLPDRLLRQVAGWRSNAGPSRILAQIP